MLDLSVLNSEQRQAVEASLDPVLVLAGAGSGKTRVLTYRIAYLLERKLISPENVLALTFTNKAAREMSERIDLLLGGFSLRAYGAFMGTFHGLGVKILRRFGEQIGVRREFTIIDQEDRLKLIKAQLEKREVGDEANPKVIAHVIHNMKNSLLSFQEVTSSYPPFLVSAYSQAVEDYEKALRSSGLVDLDDLIFLPLQLLSMHQETLAIYQKTFRAIFVDEYQDTNPAQYGLLKLLCPPGLPFVVGDDAQSIYGFRGSDVTNIFRFEQDFPKAKVFTLEQNYRSTNYILNVADAIIQHSSNQIPKKLWTESLGGQKIVVRELEDETGEAAFISSTIISLANGQEGLPSEAELEEEGEEQASSFSILDYLLQKRGVTRGSSVRYSKLGKKTGNLGQFAVLYRTHAQSRALETALVASGIPYKIFGGLRFFERKEIKDAVAVLRLLANPKDILAWARAIATPPKGLGSKALGEIASMLETLEVEAGEVEKFWLKFLEVAGKGLERRASKPLLEYANILKSLATEYPELDLSAWLSKVLKLSGLLEYHSKDEDSGQERRENLLELVNLATGYGQGNWQSQLPLLLEEASLLGEAEKIEEGDFVTLMTLHSSKGLEFDTVFFAGLEEGLLPHIRSFSSLAEMDEEVRLAYVGVTRAKRNLFLTFARRRGVFGTRQEQSPSRLLRNLPEQAVTWKGRRPISIMNLDTTSKLRYEPYVE
jgi:DNA helicase-2/ATP-dependent DNA helicase PcrA